MSNTITLPQSVFKRLEKISTTSRRTPESIVKQAVKNQLEYEEWFDKQVAAGLADDKAGRVISDDEFWKRIGAVKSAEKKAA